MKKYNLIIIGAGPAGISCAISAHKAGLKNILLIERRNILGGILNQCIHDGFGLISHHHSLTGPEFSAELIHDLSQTDVQVETGAYVSEINYDAMPYTIEYISKDAQLIECTAVSIVLATGCKEKPFGSLRIPGTRPSGIFSAGSAQYMMNIKNMLPGKSVVILGLGDIGMIMARRLTLEGARVKLILGLEKTGLERNFQNCIVDFHIPYKENYTIISVHGHNRIKGVTIAPLNENRQPDFEKKQYISCDTLLVAAGLLPEKDLCPLTKKENVFLCGNVNKIFSLVDYVVEEGEYIGLKATEQILGKSVNLTRSLDIVYKKLTSQKNTLYDLKSNNTIVCRECPKGCHLVIEKEGNNMIISGNSCLSGEKFAREERLCPKQILTSTIKLKNMPFRLLPIRTNIPVPLNKHKEIIKVLNEFELDPQLIKHSTTLFKNILNTGADIITVNQIINKLY